MASWKSGPDAGHNHRWATRSKSCFKNRHWLNAGIGVQAHPLQHFANSLLVTEHLIGIGMSNQENESIRQNWRRTLDSSKVLDQIVDQSRRYRRKIEAIRFEVFIVQFEKCRVSWLPSCDEHDLERLL